MRPIDTEMTEMTRRFPSRFIATFMLASGVVAFAAPAMAESPVGHWMTEAGPRQAKVEIKKCSRRSEALCSKIVWLKQPKGEDGRPLRDMRNKDASQRGRPILGMPIVSDLVPVGGGQWSGNVYNPEDGNTYNAKFALISEDKAQLKGCAMFGMICGQKIWTRVKAEPDEPRQAAVKPKEEPKPEKKPEPRQPEEIPAELWMDPALLDQQQQQEANAPGAVDAPMLESSIDPETPESPSLPVPKEPRFRQGQQPSMLGEPAQAAVEPSQESAPAAVAPLPVQKPKVAKPVAKSKPRKAQRRARSRRKEVLPWLAEQ